MGFLSKKLQNIASKTQDLGEGAVKGIQEQHKSYQEAKKTEERQTANAMLVQVMKAQGMDDASVARYVELSDKYQDAAKNGRTEEARQATEEMTKLCSQIQSREIQKEPGAQSSIGDEVAKLAKLKEQGAITESEFTLMKQELIRKAANPAPQPYAMDTGTPWDFMRSMYGASNPAASMMSNKPLPSDMTKVQHMILTQLRAGVRNPKHIEQMLSMDRKEVERDIEILIANGYVTKDKKLTSKGLEVL